MFESWGASLMMALSTVAAFVVGRLLAFVVRRSPRARRRMQIAVLATATLAVVYFLVTPSSRYALLLPAAFAFAFVTYGHARMAPGVFDK